MLTVEDVYKIMSSLYELGLEWCLGPETLLKVIRGEELNTLDIAVCYSDIEQVRANFDKLRELNITKVFMVPYGGFSRRCVYVRALPCISVEDAVLSVIVKENCEYFNVVKKLLEHSKNNLDMTYLRVMCERLGICDVLCSSLGLCL